MPKSTRRRKSPTILDKDGQHGTEGVLNKAKRPRTLATARTNNPSNFLSQLQTLREFTQGCGSYTERDLSQCLRQSGYNVQVAAEKLITGQYVASPTGISTPASAASAPVSVSSSEIELEAREKTWKKDTVQCLSLTSQLKDINKESVQVDRSHIMSTTSKDSVGTSHGSKSTSTNGTIKKEKYDNASLLPRQSRGMNSDTEVVPSSGLMLCQRWVCGLSTLRNGSIQHNEHVMVFTSSNVVVKNAKGSNIVRFKGDNIEGTLDNHLSSFLSPLLRVRNEKDDSGNDNDTAFIGIFAKGLMEDSRIDIGMEVPLELNVVILRPQEFFSLFDEPVGNALTKNKDNFWAVRNSGKNSVMAKAAFDLLQWAQYSCLPKFKTNSIRSDDDDRENGPISSCDEKDNIDKTDQTSDDNVAEEETPDWVQDLYSKHEPASEENIEIADPMMLNEKGIHLRCYQRQALNWMIYREEHASEHGSKEFKEHFDLLSELSSISYSPDSSLYDGDDSKVDVQCAVGPVKVSRELAERSITLDGNRSSHVSHPLWQKRFLWSKGPDGNGKEIYCFYVNELLQMASKAPPNPPKQCRGGILADSMGLGKTVMLMALIAKDVETRDDKRKNNDETASPKLAADEENVIHIDDDMDENNNEGTDSVHDELTTTPVVTPLSLLSQWEDEILSKSKLSCLIYYGDQAKRITADDIARVDILITTYGMLQSEYISKNDTKSQTTNTPLLSLTFRRVILDEAHYIKNPNTGASKACCMIKAERRWCVTGTPISNSLQDVFGLIKFLKHEPWCVPRFWKRAIETAKRANNENDSTEDIPNDEATMATSMERVRRVIKPILLRRTKDTLSSDGKPILTLPPVETKLITVHLSEEERYFYNVLLSRSQNVFEGFIQSGTATKSWFAIFALLQRLRQSCDHLALTVRNSFDFDADDDLAPNTQAVTEHHSNDNFIKELLESVKRKKTNDSPNESGSQAYSEKIVDSLTQCIQSNGTLNEECAICLEIPSTSDLALTPCSHIFCRTCLLDSLERKKSTLNSNNGQCPICAMEVAEGDVICTKVKEAEPTALISSDADKENFDARQILESALKGKCSSKMLAILHEIDTIWQEDPGSKILIFSQYLGMFDLLQKEFARQGIKAFRLDGKMSLNDRRQTVKQFNTSRFLNNGKPRGIVLLASMKACGVGMNLTAASSVFIVDPWWNDAMESQCINRIHRIGQTAPIVKVRKFIVSDSVEEKIVKMQHRKQGMANEVLSEESATSKKANPTLDDLRAIFGR